jgi:hypothetical protein
MIDEFAYPPRVQEALDLVERETKRLKREARQAACSHEHTVDVRTLSGIGDMDICAACGLNLRESS